MMAKFDTREMTEYRLICQAMWPDDGCGCSGTGRSGYSHREAIELAEEDGWKLIEDRWACPAHVRGRENTEPTSTIEPDFENIRALKVERDRQ